MGSIKGQKHNPYIEGRYAHVNKNDVVFTPDWLAKKICSMFNIEGEILEPCKGEGVFLKYLPENTKWCEIVGGRNFFDFNEKVDWIVTNPPYSDYNRFLEHSFKLAENIVLLVPVAKMMKSMGTIKSIMNYGGIVSCHFLSGGKAGFPFGFPVGIYHLKKGYFGKTLFRELNLDDSQKALSNLSPPVQTSKSKILTSDKPKGFNMGLEVQKSKISSPKLSPTEITSHHPNIMFNSDKALVGVEKQDGS